jgi:PEP-CTERM motif
MTFRIPCSPVGAAVFLLSCTQLIAGTVYDNLPNPIPQSSPSLGFQSNHTAEFGDLIQTAGGATNLTSATILMNDWAVQSDYPGIGDASGWSWPITLTFYNVDSSSGTPQPGSVIYATTQTFNMPWAPSSTQHQNFLIDFDLPDVATPPEFIYSIAYNTENFGAAPTGVSGPYISLNVAVNSTASPQVGTRPNPDSAYLNADNCAGYSDNCTGGPAGVFRQDTGWTPYSIAAAFATPEPGTLGLLLCGGIGIVGLARKRRSRTV